MSKENKEITVSETVAATGVAASINHQEAAQTRVDELRAMREAIPHFSIPETKGGSSRLSAAANLPPEFVELAAMTIRNAEVLVGGPADPATMRDLSEFAASYGPVADELEALASFLRHSVILALNKAGADALLTYEIAKRLSKRPEHADLIPFVADMSRALGVRARLAKAAAERRKAAAEKAAGHPDVTPPPQSK